MSNCFSLMRETISLSAIANEVKMQINSKPFIQIDREYIITSAELRKALKLEGQIETIGLHTGRSPNDKRNGISAEVDKWYIKTIEVKATADNSDFKTASPKLKHS